ncbi:MAG: peptide chain release factor H [Alphaproteobacteria bacterium]|nr:peptide chain release factor H [Alphaproteobacteria bacterium]
MSGIILHITAGRGPAECEWVVAKLADAFCREAAKDGLVCAPVEPFDGPCPSIMLRVEGDAAETFAAARTGTVRWIGSSPFRPTHKRRNWFVGVNGVSEIEDTPDLQERDIVYQTMRASGPGGQHVNKTDSAVRATHAPSGLITVSQDQRSQHANKKVARLKLALMLSERREREVADGKSALWAQNHQLERGNAVRTYEGEAFKLKR